MLTYIYIQYIYIYIYIYILYIFKRGIGQELMNLASKGQYRRGLHNCIPREKETDLVTHEDGRISVFI